MCDTVLALAITFMLLFALFPASALPAPQQPSSTQQQSPSKAQDEMQQHFHQLDAPALAPTLGPSPTSYFFSMQPHSKTFLQWVQDHLQALLASPTGCRRERGMHQKSSDYCHLG